MGHVALALGVLLVATAAGAEEAKPPAAPERSGYAFDSPRVLARQRLFGLAHGIRLLVLACRSQPTAAASDAAYAAWRTRQGLVIAAAVAEISIYYFGQGTADWQSLAQKLALKDTLDYAPDSPELEAACATLPEALEQPRYNLAERLAVEELKASAALTP